MYSNYIFGIDKNNFSPANDNTFVETMDLKGHFELYLEMLYRVGEPWNWTKRPKYADEAALKARLNNSSSQLHLLKPFKKPIGYCLTIDRPKMSSEFKRVAEIENFGIIPEYNAKSYGGPFLQEIFKRVFDRGFDYIHLESRSTNHEKVVPFYLRNGMKLMETISNLPDDLVNG